MAGKRSADENDRLRIKNEQGRLIDSDTVKPGRESARRDTG